MSPNELPPREITVSWKTILKILVACLLAWLAVTLWPLIEWLFLGLLVAIPLWSIVRWAINRGWPKWVGVLLSTLLVIGVVMLLAGVLIPTTVNQGRAMIQKLPAMKNELLGRLPAESPVRDSINQLSESFSLSNPEPLIKQFVAWGSVALQSVTSLLLVLTFAIYFLVDGPRIYEWLLAFLPLKQRRKAAEAGPELMAVVSQFMVGQLITSALCTVYSFIVLTLFHVPSALLLALLAGLLDVLPVVGFFLSTAPAVALALTVSPTAALCVLALYLAYNAVENYYIVPKVYGDQLKLSTLTVLTACMAGGLADGVVGAIAILPIVASYAIIERIWLKPHLEPGTVEKHEAIDDQMAG